MRQILSLSLALFGFSSLSFSQNSPQPTSDSQKPESKKEVTKPSLVPVYAPSKETGVIAIRIPHQLFIQSFGFSDEDFKNALKNKVSGPLLVESYTVRDRSGKVLKVAGIGTFKNSIEEADSAAIWVYLAEPVTEIPSVKVWIEGKQKEVVTAEPADASFDPATLGKPSSFRLLGFQPAAQLIGGGTAAAYQVAVDHAFSDSLRLSGIGSTSFLDQQAQFKLAVAPKMSGPLKDAQVDFYTNQLGTNQMFQIGTEGTQRYSNGTARNYRGEAQPLATSTGGIYFARQLRIDPRVGGPNARLGSGMYIGSRNSADVLFSQDGFSRFNLGIGIYLFPFGADRQFGTRFFEFTYDFGVQLPIQRPRQLKSGFSNDGMWFRLGFFGGIQPGNAFNQVQGIRFDIVRSF